jgi:oligopeptide transport system substrate-binding protein
LRSRIGSRAGRPTVPWPTSIRYLLLVVALVVSGCSMQGARSQNTTGPDAIIRAYAGEPQNGLVPTNTAENMGGRAVDALFTGLYAYTADGVPELANAESVDTTDNQNFVVHLKRDWKFTDGTPVKAENYVRAWNYGAYTPNAQLQQSFFAPIEGYSAVAADHPAVTEMSGLKVIDDYTFSVKLTSPNIDFKLGLGFTLFKPVPDVFFTEGAKAFGEHPIGNGAYKFRDADAWRHNVQLDLIRNPDYRGPDRPRNGGISFLFYASTDTAYADLQSGNLDVLELLPTSALRSYKRVLGSRGISKPTAQNLQIAIPYYLPHFSGEEGRLRRAAISMAFDRTQIISTLFPGARTASRDFSARTLPGWKGDLAGSDVLSFNPDQAKKLWKQADAIAPWSGSFQIAYNSDGDHKLWVDALTNQLKNNLGIDSSGAPVPTFKQVRDQVTKKTIRTAFRSGWQGDYPSMMEFLAPQFVTGAGSNDAQYADPAFDAALDAAQRAVDPTVSYALAGKAQELLLRDLPVIPLWDYIAVGGVGTGVHARLTWNGVPDYTQITKD